MEKEVVKVDINKSLMKKTKVQLIEIILRKDAKEIELQNEIKTLKKTVNNKYEEIEEKDIYISELQNEIDNNVEDISVLKKDKVKCYKELENYKSKTNKRLNNCILAFILFVVIAIIAILKPF